MKANIHHCVYCGKAITTPPLDADKQEKVYCSFGCEVKGLLGGLGWGVRWLATSLAWGGVLFALFMMAGRVIFGESVSGPASYYGLMVVLVLLTAILSALLRRMKG